MLQRMLLTFSSCTWVHTTVWLECSKSHEQTHMRYAPLSAHLLLAGLRHKHSIKLKLAVCHGATGTCVLGAHRICQQQADCSPAACSV
jgi:hypothetical protein